MTKRFKTAFASLAVAALCTLGVTSQASAFDLLEELLGGDKYADSCGCSQKSGGHVQRCGSNCGGKSSGGHVQHAVSGKGGSFGGHAQRGGCGDSKGGSCGGHAQRGGCGDSKGGSCGGHAQRGGCGDSKGGKYGGHAQRGGCGDSKGGKYGGHVQRGDIKGGSSKSSCQRVDLFGMMRAKMAHVKCKLSAPSCDCECGYGKDGGKGYDLEFKSGGYGDGKPLIVPAPVFSEDLQSVPVPVPSDPDPTT